MGRLPSLNATEPPPLAKRAFAAGELFDSGVLARPRGFSHTFDQGEGINHNQVVSCLLSSWSELLGGKLTIPCFLI